MNKQTYDSKLDGKESKDGNFNLAYQPKLYQNPISTQNTGSQKLAIPAQHYDPLVSFPFTSGFINHYPNPQKQSIDSNLKAQAGRLGISGRKHTCLLKNYAERAVWGATRRGKGGEMRESGQGLYGVQNH